MAHQCVSGYSCMEVDRIFEYRDGIELMEGDGLFTKMLAAIR